MLYLFPLGIHRMTENHKMAKKVENGKAGPKKIMSVRIDPKLQERVKQVARKKDRTVSWLVSDFIQKGLAAEATS